MTNMSISSDDHDSPTQCHDEAENDASNTRNGQLSRQSRMQLRHRYNQRLKRSHPWTRERTEHPCQRKITNKIRKATDDSTMTTVSESTALSLKSPVQRMASPNASRQHRISSNLNDTNRRQQFDESSLFDSSDNSIQDRYAIHVDHNTITTVLIHITMILLTQQKRVLFARSVPVLESML